MAVAKIIEIISGSKKSFDDAMKQGIERVNDSVTEVTGAWIKDQRVVVTKGSVTEYRVVMKVTFIVKDKAPARKK
ncbi:dodecin family protein [Hydrogenophaga sp.]|jgi:flavin-binding protein dodecin|uniref:dodecin family protein n=1 Tax=Hydrogenophaga sp. TaxID=1904254 RepID=UPI00262ED064|nr:dodecin family protein [Hydrogenophaga sp.]MDM7948130.1 dodecin family protein [Hydrogenophaga sp.]